MDNMIWWMALKCGNEQCNENQQKRKCLYYQPSQGSGKPDFIEQVIFTVKLDA